MKIDIPTYGGRDAHSTKPSISCGVGVPPAIVVSLFIFTYLIAELGEECLQVQALIHQLQLPHLSARERAEILAQLLAAAIYLNVHCGEYFQTLIAEEMEKFSDDDEQE